MPSYKVMPLVAALALVIVASGAEATWSGARSWNKWQCYVPGCNSCKPFAPTHCEECDTANGYALLADHTCGCAAGYGSYAVPASGNLPSKPPMCPNNKLYSKHLVTKPYYCSKHYYADNICQTSPVSGSGYCQCFRCPVGYTGAGGAISNAVCSSGSAPTPTPSPGPNPVVPKPRGTCKGVPPTAPNANPWTKANRINPCKNHPKLQLLNKNGQCAATCKTGATPSPIAPVATCVGRNWVITGSCSAGLPAPACPGAPPAGTNAQPWAATCKDGAAGASCTTTCQTGFEGTASATCNAQTGWSVSSTCIRRAVACPGTPPTGENARPFTCQDGNITNACEAECLAGFTGKADALCGPDGWDVFSDCQPETDAVSCRGYPPDITADNALPWSTGDDDPVLVCKDAAEGDYCEVKCADGPEFDWRYAYAECSAEGWQIVENLCTEEYEYEYEYEGPYYDYENGNGRRVRRRVRGRATKRSAAASN